MSGSLADLLARPMGVDVLTPLTGYQNLAKGQSEIDLRRQQTQAAALANQLSALQLGIRGAVAGPLGVSVPGGASGIGGGASEPGASAPASAGVLGQLPGAPGAKGAGSDQAPMTAAQAAWQPVSPTGVMSPYGVPLPRMRLLQAVASPDMNAGIHQLMDDRRTRLIELYGQGPEGVRQAYDEGWIDQLGYNQAMRGGPAAIAKAMDHLQSPGEYRAGVQGMMGMGVRRNAQGYIEIDPTMIGAEQAKAGAGEAGRKAAGLPYVGPWAEAQAGGTIRGERGAGGAQYAGEKAAATAGGAGQFETTQITIPDPLHPGQFRTDTVLRSALPTYMAQNSGAKPATAADFTNPAVTLGPSAYAARLRGSENAGGAPNEKSKSSSAMGDAQFTEGTWNSVVSAAKPDWALGMSYKDFQAARGKPEYALPMAYAYAQQNGARLASAGIPTNSMNLGLAHQFGPDGAIKVLSASPNTPMSKIVSQEVLDANPELKRQDVSDVMARAFKHYGNNAVDLTQPYSGAPAAAPGAGAGGVASEAAPSTGVPGAVAGVPKLPPAAEAGLTVAQDRMKSDQGIVQHLMEGAQQAQAQQQNLTQFRDIAAGLRTGAGGENRQAIQNFLATYAPDMAQKFTKSLSLGLIDPSEAGEWQKAVKQALLTYSTLERQNNPAGGVGITQLYQSAFPNLETQPSAARDMSNVMLISGQRQIDHAQAMQTHADQQTPDALRDPRQYKPLQTAEAGFLKSNPPRLYVGSAALLNGKPFAEWSKGLSKEQQAEAYRTAWRADPTAVLLDPTGKPFHNPALKE